MSIDTCPKCGAPRVPGPECPKCGVIYARAEQTAYQEKRQERQGQQKHQRSAQAPPIPNEWIKNPAHYSIDCTACKLSGGMEKSSVHRFPVLIRIIGWIIATPSAVGMLLGFFIMFRPSGSFGMDAGGFFFGGIFVMFSAAGGLVGWLLLMSKKAFVCQRCGFMLDRA